MHGGARAFLPSPQLARHELGSVPFFVVLAVPVLVVVTTCSKGYGWITAGPACLSYRHRTRSSSTAALRRPPPLRCRLLAACTVLRLQFIDESESEKSPVCQTARSPRCGRSRGAPALSHQDQHQGYYNCCEATPSPSLLLRPLLGARVPVAGGAARNLVDGLAEHTEAKTAHSAAAAGTAAREVGRVGALVDVLVHHSGRLILTVCVYSYANNNIRFCYYLYQFQTLPNQN